MIEKRKSLAASVRSENINVTIRLAVIEYQNVSFP
jgi:hypothetical protein